MHFQPIMTCKCKLNCNYLIMITVKGGCLPSGRWVYVFYQSFWLHVGIGSAPVHCFRSWQMKENVGASTWEVVPPDLPDLPAACFPSVCCRVPGRHYHQIGRSIITFQIWQKLNTNPQPESAFISSEFLVSGRYVGNHSHISHVERVIFWCTNRPRVDLIVWHWSWGFSLKTLSLMS